MLQVKERTGTNMPQPNRDRSIMTKLEWGVVFSVIASSASMVFSAGVIWTTVQQQERDIAMLKVNDSDRIDRLARIETKLDIIISGNKGD